VGKIDPKTHVDRKQEVLVKLIVVSGKSETKNPEVQRVVLG
jgi:hypothetical protein